MALLISNQYNTASRSISFRLAHTDFNPSSLQCVPPHLQPLQKTLITAHIVICEHHTPWRFLPHLVLDVLQPPTIKFFAHVFIYLCVGTEKARVVAQNILDVPYGEGDEEKLDVYMPVTSSPGKVMQRETILFIPTFMSAYIKCDKTKLYYLFFLTLGLTLLMISSASSAFLCFRCASSYLPPWRLLAVPEV